MIASTFHILRSGAGAVSAAHRWLPTVATQIAIARAEMRDISLRAYLVDSSDEDPVREVRGDTMHPTG